MSDLLLMGEMAKVRQKQLRQAKQSPGLIGVNTRCDQTIQMDSRLRGNDEN